MNQSSAPAADVLKLRERALAEGRVVVTLPDGRTEVRSPALPRQRKRKRRSRTGVDPFATTRKVDRPMDNEQRSELRSLCRELRLPFDGTLTRGEASRLVPLLRQHAKTLQREQADLRRRQLSKRKKRERERR